MTQEQAFQFYKEHEGKFFHKKLLSSMTRGPIECLILEGEDAISRWRSTMGPTLREFAVAQPNTIRGKFGSSDTRNVVHGSSNPQDAIKEITFFFQDFNPEC